MRRVRLLLCGAVQGVGMRPALVRHARGWQLSGWVRNLSGAVELEVQGRDEQLSGFLESFPEALPRAARLDGLVQLEVPTHERSEGFEVLQSEAGHGNAPTLSADRVICEACWGEILAPGDRRSGYALNSCAECGPRYSMTRGAPYDRRRTSLNAFPLCATCQAEYDCPSDRRFHTEGIACPTCGPTVRWRSSSSVATTQAPIDAAVAALSAGEVIGLKGVSGFQLLVDATNEEAVARLRERKRRPLKPLAVLFRDLKQVESYATLNHTEISALRDPAGPIVLCRGREPVACVAPLAPSVSPLPDADWTRGVNPWIGALLPTSGLHGLLAERFGKPLVCTSANQSEEPLCAELSELYETLPGVCDGVLDHDRGVVRRLDDSLVRISDGDSQRAPASHVLRRGRGLVPHPHPMNWAKAPPGQRAPTVFALGGQLKAAVCWLEGDQAELSQHLGDLHGVAAIREYEAAIEDFLMRRGRPDAIACDAHPDYASSRIAEALAARLEVPLQRVSHHRSHVAAVLAERGMPDNCLALAWDGLGLGEDGELWGGEAFLFRGDRDVLASPRVASVRRFALLGGEGALREPRRVALSLLLQAELPLEALEGAFSASELRNLTRIWQSTPANCSSIGRVFDAVSSLVGLCQRNSYEAHAASLLELCALHGAEPEPLGLSWLEVPSGAWQLDWAPLLAELLQAMQRGSDPKALALGFHHAVADAAVELALRFRADSLLLSGGCFQNALLLQLLEGKAALHSLPCVSPSRIPAGDGGLALGQAALVRARLLASTGSAAPNEARPCA